MNYEFIGIDEGNQNLLRASTEDTKVKWKLDLSDFPTARAIQRIDADQVLLGYDRGYCIVDITEGNILHVCEKWKGVTSAHRMPDGTALITGMNLEGQKGITVLTLNNDDRIINTACRRGGYVRLLSPIEDGGYLICINRALGETDLNLKMIRKFRARGFQHIWKAHRYKDGTTLVSAGYGAFMALFSVEGKLIRKFGMKGDLSPEIRPYFYANFDHAHDGNLLVANWQGHGPDNGYKGKQLLCFNSEYEYLDSWSFPNEISSLQGILVL